MPAAPPGHLGTSSSETLGCRSRSSTPSRIDVRFPTSVRLDGSDALNQRPDYSAAYVILRTDSPDGIEGHGLTFTTGRGNELCVAAIAALAPRVVGRTLEE